MADTEGSVLVDGVDGAISEESTQDELVKSQEEGSEESSEDTTSEDKESISESQKEEEEESGKEEEVKSEEKPEEKPEDDSKVEKTDKGTKLAEDPLSRANQLRANAEAEVRQYYSLLNDPDRLEAYIKELKQEKGVKGKTSEENLTSFETLDPTKLETVGDLQKFAQDLKEATVKEIGDVKKGLYGITNQQREEGLSRKISGDISAVQTKYPELRELNADGSKNPDYNPELDALVGSTYNELDLDKRTGKYRGQISPMAIADKLMSARQLGEGAGSRKAQTNIVDKRKGRAIGTSTSSVDTKPDEEKLSASATIASRMQRAAKKKK